MFNDSQFQNMHVINSKLAHFSAAEMRISTTAVMFNFTTASELQYPPRACILADGDCHTIVLIGCDNNTAPEYDIPFATPEFLEHPSRQKRIVYRDRHFVQSIRAANGWNFDKKARKVCGLFYAQHRTIAFNLEEATMLSGGKRKIIPSIRNYPTLAELQQNFTPQRLQLPDCSVCVIDA